MSIFRLAFSLALLVIFTLWSLVKYRWIPRVLSYLRCDHAASGVIASLIKETEELELTVNKAVQTRWNLVNPLPEDLQQRSAKLPELIRR